MFVCDCGSTHGDAHTEWCPKEFRCISCGISAKTAEETKGSHYGIGMGPDRPIYCPYNGQKCQEKTSK